MDFKIAVQLSIYYLFSSALVCENNFNLSIINDVFENTKNKLS